MRESCLQWVNSAKPSGKRAFALGLLRLRNSLVLWQQIRGRDQEKRNRLARESCLQWVNSAKLSGNCTWVIEVAQLPCHVTTDKRPSSRKTLFLASAVCSVLLPELKDLSLWGYYSAFPLVEIVLSPLRLSRSRWVFGLDNCLIKNERGSPLASKVQSYAILLEPAEK